MLEGLKRWFGSGKSESRFGLDEFASWATARQYVLRQPREGEGLIVDGRQGSHPWRLEWGPSQRPYVDGSELRIRADVAVSSDLQVLVLNRALQESMEKAVFEQYVEGVQTRIDNQTPPEMRWLVMFQKLGGTELGRLRERYAAVGSNKPWLMHWLEGGLTQALMTVSVEEATPLVLMIGRGRLTLRTAMVDADPREFEPMLKLFDAALREARRVISEASAAGTSTG
jgi:hypothetical protein